MKNVENIIFDFDGTLADTAQAIVDTLHGTVQELGIDPRTEEEYRSIIGIRLEDIPPVLWPSSELSGEVFAATYRRVFNILNHTTPVKFFPGVLDTLGRLHRDGYRMAIASSRSRKSLEECVGTLGIADYFAMLVGGGDVAHGKPAPDPVLAILDRCRWDADRTLTVGDAPVDIEMGRAAATATCAVTYGNGTITELAAARPNYIIDSFDQLLTILEP